MRVSAIFGGLQKLINGDPSEKTRDKYQSTVAKINAFAAATAELSDEQLRAKTTQFKNALASGAALDSILPEAFAVSGQLVQAQQTTRVYSQSSRDCPL